MRALVAGMGSIGLRHGRVLKDLGHEVGAASRRSGYSITAAVTEFAPDYVVIATETANHWPALQELAATGFDGKVMVEKPLFDRPLPLPANRFAAIGVGYPLRFDARLAAARINALAAPDAAAFIHVGQHLGSWRPGRDYRQTYSASRALGGGVLRDLSHELDYAAWLFGRARIMQAVVGKFSDLDMDCEDTAVVFAEFERCPAVAIHMNCVDRQRHRGCNIVGRHGHTDRIDLTDSAPDTLTRAMHNDFLSGGGRTCTADEAIGVLAMIEAIERCAA